MARARNLKPSFFTNDELADLPPIARLLFQGLWTIADRRGRLFDRPKKIKAEVLPYDDCDVDGLLDRLDAAGFIRRYEAAGERYIHVVNFERHQNPHKNEPESRLPPPGYGQNGTAPEPHRTTPVLVNGEAGSAPADSGLPLTDSGLLTAATGDRVPIAEPPPPSNESPSEPTNGTVPGDYEAELGDSVGKLAKAMGRLDRQLTEPWLRLTLQAIGPKIGHLPRDRLMVGLDLALDQLTRKHGNGGITSPRGFAAKLIEDYLREQIPDAAAQTAT